MSDVRWVALGADSQRRGEFTAPDRETAEAFARGCYGQSVVVQSLVSWEVARESVAQLTIRYVAVGDDGRRRGQFSSSSAELALYTARRAFGEDVTAIPRWQWLAGRTERIRHPNRG